MAKFTDKETGHTLSVVVKHTYGTYNIGMDPRIVISFFDDNEKQVRMTPDTWEQLVSIISETLEDIGTVKQ